MTRSYGRSISSYPNHLHTVFRNSCASLHSQQESIRVPFAPCPCHHLLFLCILDDNDSNCSTSNPALCERAWESSRGWPSAWTTVSKLEKCMSLHSWLLQPCGETTSRWRMALPLSIFPLPFKYIKEKQESWKGGKH